MKYKILINAGIKNQQLIKDFFRRTETSFTCLTTSGIYEDITGHMDLFKPDAYLCYYEFNDDNTVNQIRTLKSRDEYKGIPIIIMGDADACGDFEKKLSGAAAATIKKPFSSALMEQYIKKFLNGGITPALSFSHTPSSASSASKPASAAKGPDISLEELMAEFGEKPSGPKHILVVDDDRNVLKMLKAALSEKYDVTTVISGRLALKFLETKRADLILLDYEMPIETGPEVFQKIKENHRTADIPVVFLTGVADSSKIKNVLMLRPQGYLLKPINMDRLQNTIKEILK